MDIHLTEKLWMVKEAHEKLLNIVGHQGNANQNHNEIQLHSQNDGSNQKDGQVVIIL